MIHGCLDALVQEIVQERAKDKRSVLHNSGPSRSSARSASRKGADDCRRILFPMGERFASANSVARWPAGVGVDNITDYEKCVASADSLEKWCDLLGLTAAKADQAANILREAATHAADKLMRLPPIAAVLPNTSGETLAGLSDDPLLTLAVLSRTCGGRVFIRNKSPIIEQEYLCRKVSLVVPKSWRFES